MLAGLADSLDVRNRRDALKHLQDTYGQKGPKGWSLTEVLQLRRAQRTRLMDLLAGIVKGRANQAAQYPGRFLIKTVSGKPLEIQKVLPDPDEEPALTEAARPDGEAPERHYAPNQWVPLTFEIPPEVEVPLSDSHTPTNCATWLLLQYGWGAREGGSTKRRWGDKRAKQEKRPPEEWVDRWLVYEEAYRARNPKAFAELKGG